MLQGPIEVGEAVVTTGHDLKARWVIHVALTGAGPQPTPASSPRRRSTVAQGAPSAHARSVAMPAFGTGAGGFPLYQCASIMVAETVALPEGAPQHGAAAHSMLSVYNDAARAAFKNAMAGIGRF